MNRMVNQLNTVQDATEVRKQLWVKFVSKFNNIFECLMLTFEKL